MRVSCICFDTSWRMMILSSVSSVFFKSSSCSEEMEAGVVTSMGVAGESGTGLTALAYDDLLTGCGISCSLVISWMMFFLWGHLKAKVW